MSFSLPEGNNQATEQPLEQLLKEFEQVVYILRYETYEQCAYYFEGLQFDGVNIDGSTSPETALDILKTDVSERVAYDASTQTKENIDAPTLLCVEASIVQRNITIHETIDRVRRMVSCVTPVALVRERVSHSKSLVDSDSYIDDPAGYETMLARLEEQQVPIIEITNMSAEEILRASAAKHRART